MRFVEEQPPQSTNNEVTFDHTFLSSGCKTPIVDIGSPTKHQIKRKLTQMFLPDIADHLEMMETANVKEKCELELSQHNKRKKLQHLFN